jgi:hypothetical protein
MLWLRSLSMASICCGALGLLTVHFWWAVGFFYCGILLIGVDVFLEPWFRCHTISRSFALVIILVILFSFSVGVTFSNDPLLLNATQNDIAYVVGSIIGGISWQPEYADVRLLISNSSSRDFEHLEIRVSADGQIENVAQISALPGVSISPVNFVKLGISSNSERVVGTPPQSRNYVYRISCDRLPSHATLEFVAAITQKSLKLHIDPQHHPTAEEAFRVFDSPKMIRPHPKELAIEGQYYGPLRLRRFKRILEIT